MIFQQYTFIICMMNVQFIWSALKSNIFIGDKQQQIQFIIKQMNCLNKINENNNQKTIQKCWQILNYFQVEGSLKIPSLKDIHIKMTKQQNTLKHMSIFYYNWISRHDLRTLSEDEKANAMFWMKTIVRNHYYLNKKQEVQALEWLGYILQKILCTIPSVVEYFKEKKEANQLLNIYVHFFKAVIENKCTTELVIGFQCSLQDIKDSYAKKCTMRFKISQTQLIAICALLCFHIDSSLKQDSFESNELINCIVDLLNCVLFLGGYNNKLQTFVGRICLQPILLYFQFTALKIGVKVYQSSKYALFQTDQKKTDDPFLAPLVQLLSNLIHINAQNQKVCANNMTAIDLIWILGNKAVVEPTLREWSIVFIRNVCEFNESVRVHIEKKTQEKEMFKIDYDQKQLQS